MARYVGWVRVYLRPSRWVAASSASTEGEARKETMAYLKGVYRGDIKGLSLVILPEGLHPEPQKE